AGRLAAEPAVYHRVASGNQTIARVGADLLPDVRLGSTVSAVAQRAGSVRVMGRERVRASAAVVAVPAPIAGRIDFDPPLAPDQLAAVRELPMGVASKLALPLEGDPELLAVQCADASFWFWGGKGSEEGPRPVVTSFAGSEQVQGLLETASGGPGGWVRQIAALAPELRLGGPATMKVWASDEFALGAYSAWDARSVGRGDLFARMHGAVAFAGEHTAGDHAGTMEGALRSGRRAALEVLEQLGRA
ncbi:MAG: FAD-dependent oxidoreductase, partial [Actinomycetota bacterium]